MSTKMQIPIIRDHSFLQNAEFWAVPRNLPVSAEFLYFLWNLVLAGDKSTNMPYFVRIQAAIDTICRHDCAMKYATATRALTGYWAEFIWNNASLFDRQSVSVSCGKYYIHLSRLRGCRRLITISGKLAAVSCGIWQTSPRNLEKFAAENCGPYL